MPDVSTGFWVIVGFLAAVLVVVAFLEKVYGWSRWVRSKLRPEPPEPPMPPPVYISEQIPSSVSLADGADGKRYLSRISPMYEIHNGSPEHRIRNVTTGVRRRGHDRGGHQFEWHEAIIEPLRNAVVRKVEIPPEMFRDVHESVGMEAFVVWARFTDASGGVWEVWRDAHTKQAGEQLDPPPLDDGGGQSAAHREAQTCSERSAESLVQRCGRAYVGRGPRAIKKYGRKADGQRGGDHTAYRDSREVKVHLVRIVPASLQGLHPHAGAGDLDLFDGAVTARRRACSRTVPPSRPVPAARDARSTLAVTARRRRPATRRALDPHPVDSRTRPRGPRARPLAPTHTRRIFDLGDAPGHVL